MASVDEILRQIEALSDDERLELDRELARRAQAEWEKLTLDARVLAQQKGSDQAAIDRAIERRRYGKQS